MKKIYLSVLSFCLVATGVAQSNTGVNGMKKESKLVVKQDASTTKVKGSNTAQSKGMQVWSNDFTNPADWAVTNTGTHPTAGWIHETDETVIPVAALAPFASATASTGFMFVNSDGNNSTDGDGTTIVTQCTNVTPIDLTGSPSVSLEFSHNYRWYQDARGVRVSGDNGATWTDYEVTSYTDYPNLQNSANPEITRFDISAVAGDSAQVLVQFYYDDQDIWAWYWAIDDVQIVENDPDDVRVDGYFTSDVENDYQYTQIPLEQARPLSFGLVVTNIGSNDQDVTVDYDIMSGGSSVDAGSAATTTILSTLKDTIFHTTPLTPSALGAYTLDMSAEITPMDFTPANNTNPTVDYVEMTDYVWARDDNSFSGGISNVSSQPGEALEIGNTFLATAASTITHVHVGITSTATNTGQLVYAKIYSYDAGTAAFVFAEQTAEYTVTAGDLGTMVSMELGSTYDLTAGGEYLVVACHYGGTDELEFATGGAAIEGSVLGYTSDGSPFQLTGPDAIAVRLQLEDPAASVNEVTENVTVSQNFPNPFNGNTTVNYTLTSTDEVMVEITDVTGKVIEVINEGVRTAGSHAVVINSNKLAAGTYYYTVSTSNGKVTNAMNVTK